MPDQRGFGNNGADSARPCQSGYGDDQMNEQDEQIAHPGNGINTSRSTAFRPIWQFAIDSSWRVDETYVRLAGSGRICIGRIPRGTHIDFVLSPNVI